MGVRIAHRQSNNKKTSINKDDEYAVLCTDYIIVRPQEEVAAHLAKEHSAESIVVPKEDINRIIRAPSEKIDDILLSLGIEGSYIEETRPVPHNLKTHRGSIGSRVINGISAVSESIFKFMGPRDLVKDPISRDGAGNDSNSPGVGDISSRIFHSGSPMILVSGDLRIMDINEKARKIFGLREGELPVAALRTPRLLKALEDVRESNNTVSIDFKLMRGGERNQTAVVEKIDEDRGGQGARILISLFDVSEYAKREQLGRDYIANTSHELKTPLASIIGSVETLKSHAREDPDASARFLDLIHDQAERMNRLVSGLLYLSAAEASEGDRQPVEMDLLKIVRDTIELYTPIAEKKGVKIEVMIKAKELMTYGKYDEIQQLLCNILENAVQASYEDGKIIIDAGERIEEVGGEERGVFISVEDLGPGIDRVHLPRLTERFYRAEPGRGRGNRGGLGLGGVGLGLAIVKHVLARHRGKLLIDSEPGRGSKFTVVMPSIIETRQ